jgi:hypothetical protein
MLILRTITSVSNESFGDRIVGAYSFVALAVRRIISCGGQPPASRWYNATAAVACGCRQKRAEQHLQVA